jgi:DNA polymerase type B, organellar and viral
MNLIAKLLMNSLYGKFGMKDEHNIVKIFNTNDKVELSNLNDWLEDMGESVTDHIQIGHYVIIVRKGLSNVRYNEKEDMFHGSDINVGIASFITAAARMHMTKFKNSPDFNLYYSDTDSIVIDHPLDSKLVGNKLGLLKLECEINRAVFLAPKVYGMVTSTNEEIIKIKGISKTALDGIHIDTLNKLLKQNSSMTFNQTKWFKEVLNGRITIDQVLYTLKVTANKREAVYENGLYSKTRPYNYKYL